MKSEIVSIIQTFVAVFFILDPFAAVPIYLTLTDRFSPEMIRRTRRKAILVAAGILLTFALTGLSVFKLFGITLPAFQIAGGILVLRFALAQLNASRRRVSDEEKSESMERDDVSVFPLGTPLLAGPGAISTVVLMSTQATSWWGVVRLVVAIIVALVATYWALKAAHTLFRVLGRTGLNIVTRIMGMILCAVAVQFILNGIFAAVRNAGITP